MERATVKERAAIRLKAKSKGKYTACCPLLDIEVQHESDLTAFRLCQERKLALLRELVAEAAVDAVDDTAKLVEEFEEWFDEDESVTPAEEAWAQKRVELIEAEEKTVQVASKPKHDPERKAVDKQRLELKREIKALVEAIKEEDGQRVEADGWKVIPGFEKYEINQDGRARHRVRKRLLMKQGRSYGLLDAHGKLNWVDPAPIMRELWGGDPSPSREPGEE